MEKTNAADADQKGDQKVDDAETKNGKEQGDEGVGEGGEEQIKEEKEGHNAETENGNSEEVKQNNSDKAGTPDDSDEDGVKQNDDDKEEEGKVVVCGGGGGGDGQGADQGHLGTQEPINIDLSRMKSLYQFRSRPTLPYLLTEYGMEDKDAPAMKQKEEKKKKKRRTFGDDSGRDKEREKLQEERHLQILKDMSRLRDFYYDEYTTLLQNKVIKQRQDIRQRSKALQDKISQQEETARQDSHHVKRRLEAHQNLVPSDDFLKDLPKSDLFYIVQLQDRLIKEGTLKSQSDLDTFWERIQQPEIFYMYFKVPKSDDFTNREDFNDNASSRATSTWKGSSSTLKGSDAQVPVAVEQKGGALRALSRIAESRESSRPATRLGQHWAITQQYPAQNREQLRERRRSSFLGIKPTTHSQQKSSFLQDLEKRFPKLEMPKLHCFTMNLGPKAPDPDEVRHKCNLQDMEKNRKKYAYKLTKMHQLAMANAAAASRILEMHEDMDFIINGAPLTDLISDQHFYSGLPPPRSAGGEVPSCSSPMQGNDPAIPFALPSLLEQDEAAMSAVQTASRKSSRKSDSAKSKRSRKASLQAIDDRPAQPSPVVPLSLGEIKDNTRVVEAKCLSTLWTNYMKETPAAKT